MEACEAASMVHTAVISTHEVSPPCLHDMRPRLYIVAGRRRVETQWVAGKFSGWRATRSIGSFDTMDRDQLESTANWPLFNRRTFVLAPGLVMLARGMVNYGAGATESPRYRPGSQLPRDERRRTHRGPGEQPEDSHLPPARRSGIVVTKRAM